MCHNYKTLPTYKIVNFPKASAVFINQWIRYSNYLRALLKRTEFNFIRGF